MYSVNASRDGSGMDFERPTMTEVLERLSDYNKDFPDEIVEVRIVKISSLSEQRQQRDATQRNGINHKIAQVISLKDEGRSNANIAREMGLSESTVRTLLNNTLAEFPKADNNG